MRILYAAFKSRDDFLARLWVGKDEPQGRLVIPTRARFERGEHVILEISMPTLANRVLVRVVARGVNASRKGDVDFTIAPGEEQKRDFLIAIAAGQVKAKVQRRHRRFPVRLPARFVAEGEDIPLRGDAETEDIGSGGLLLRASRTLAKGTRVTIILDPCDGSPEMTFPGVVAAGPRGAGGMGVQFEKLSGAEMKRLRRLIRDVKLSGKIVEWEDASGPI